MKTIPTLSELYIDVLNDLRSEFGANPPPFGKNFLRVRAGVQAARLKLYYLALGDVQKNIFADTADPEAIGGTLERFGRVKLGRNPFAARAGEYTVQITGSIGATVPANTTFKSNDDTTNPGKLFVLDAAYTLTSVTDTINLRALEAGVDSKLSVGEELSATSPIAGVEKTATVTVEVTSPSAAETTPAYRTKTLNAFREEPQGGAGSDFRLWAADAQGVQQTYPFARSGAPGEINLYVEATIADSTDGKGTPSATLLTDVQAVVELDPDTSLPQYDRGRKPITAYQVHYLPITPRTVDVVIPGFVGLTAAKQTAIETALATEIAKVRPFVSASDVLENKNDILDTNKLVSIILNAVPGSVFGAVDLQIDSISTGTFTFLNGDIPDFNSVTFV